MLIDESKIVLRTVIDAAKHDDVSAAKVLLDRILPAPKGRGIDLDIGPIETAQDGLARRLVQMMR